MATLFSTSVAYEIKPVRQHKRNRRVAHVHAIRRREATSASPLSVISSDLKDFQTRNAQDNGFVAESKDTRFIRSIQCVTYTIYTYKVSIKTKDDLFSIDFCNYRRRAADPLPAKAVVEYLIVADASIYNAHSDLIDSTNQDLIFHHMRIYFAHLVNGVNSRYNNSFGNDPDLNLDIKLKNYLFFTVCFIFIL